MNQPVILGVGTAVPNARYAQPEIYDRYLSPHFEGNRRARAIFGRAGVAYRHIAVEPDYYAIPRSTKDRNQHYWKYALDLGQAAIIRALTNAGLEPSQVHDFFAVSCTGYDVPGLDLHLAGRLRMSHNLRRTCVLGMGCYGAFPALERAREAVIADQTRIALVLTVELCSLHLQFEDTLENIVASALFADGASAVLVGMEGKMKGKPHLIDAMTFSDYQTFDHMAFYLTDHGFRMSLSAYVPDVLAANVNSFVEQLLAPHHIAVQDVRHWAIHPGSRKILDYCQSRLGLSNEKLTSSRRILHDYGNLSSATIFFVLDEITRCDDPHPGDYGVLMAFGPGLTIEASLVQWR